MGVTVGVLDMLDDFIFEVSARIDKGQNRKDFYRGTDSTKKDNGKML